MGKKKKKTVEKTRTFLIGLGILSQSGRVARRFSGLPLRYGFPQNLFMPIPSNPFQCMPL